jgi:hypothetical protein
MLLETDKRETRVLTHRATVAKWMVLSSPFACALGYLLFK